MSENGQPELNEVPEGPNISFAISHHPITQQRLLVMQIRDADGGTSQLALSSGDALSLATQLQAQGMWLHIVQQEEAYQAQQRGPQNGGIIVP